MPDLVPTVANVVGDDGTSAATAPFTGTAGAHLTQLMPVYLDTTTNTFKPADCNGNATRAAASAIVLNDAQIGQPVSLLAAGGLNPGCTLVVGEQYVVSRNSGKVAPILDLGTGDYVQYLFFADAANHAVMNLGAQGPLVQLL